MQLTLEGRRGAGLTTAHGEAVTQVDLAMDEEARLSSAIHCVTAMSSSADDGLGLEITGSPQEKSFSI